MRGALEMLGKELEEVKTDCKESLQLLLNERINKLETAKKDLQHERTILHKRNKRTNTALINLHKRLREKKLHSIGPIFTFCVAVPLVSGRVFN